ncbi:MAG: hypothetical protein LUD02_01570 [Tannerellaceae bacterium]|nr:hypothetical protein [Tannerellaceae bacterium]
MQTQKSKFGIYFYTRSNSTKVGGLKAIEVRVTVDGVSKVFTSIYEVAPEMWNQKEKKERRRRA